MKNLMIINNKQNENDYKINSVNVEHELLNIPLPSNDELQKNMLYYQQMMMLFESSLKFITMRLDMIEKECVAKGWHNPIHTVTSRIKSPLSINKKLQSMGVPLTIQSVFDCLHDVSGVRVVCEYLSDIYTIRDILIEENRMELIQEKDYIKNPKENGYRSLHLIVNSPVLLTESFQKVKCEIQLRTIAMDSWASLEHSLRYKNDIPRNMDIDNELKSCAEVLNETDKQMQSIAERVMILGRN